MSEDTTPPVPNDAVLKALGRAATTDVVEVTAETEEITADEAEQLASITKAEIAQILGRGQQVSTLRDALARVPPGRYGFFARNRSEDITKYQKLGFRVETGIDDVAGLTKSADNSVIVGDLILMTTSLDRIALIREVERDMVIAKLDLERNNYLAVASNSPVAPIDETITSRGR